MLVYGIVPSRPYGPEGAQAHARYCNRYDSLCGFGEAGMRYSV